MKKRGLVVLIILSLSLTGLVSSAQIDDILHLNIQVINSSNNSVMTGSFDFDFNISTSDDCSNVVYTNSTTLTTDSRGLISYYLENLNLNFTDQYWLCYYRDNVLINTSKIARTPYTFYANTSKYWNNLNATNSTQFENNNGILHIIENWFSIAWNNLFRNYFDQHLNTTSNVVFNTMNTSTIFETGGKIGIGTGSPTERLNVIGNVNITGNASIGKGIILFNDTDNANTYVFYNGSVWQEFGTGSGGNVSWNQSFANILYAPNTTAGIQSLINKTGAYLWTNVSGTATYIGNVNITGNLTLGGKINNITRTMVRATGTTTQTMTDAVSTRYKYDTEIIDTLNEYNPTIGVFVAKEAGYYFVSMEILTESVAWTANDLIHLEIYVNGAQYSILARYNFEASTTEYGPAYGQDIVYLNAGDNITTNINILRGANTNILNSASYNHLNIFRIDTSITIGDVGSMPAGAIVAFNRSTCPTGWILADGTSGTPDLRGIFVRGAGTSGIINYANGSDMKAVYGTYENDSFQGHTHSVYISSGTPVSGSATYTRIVGGTVAGDGATTGNPAWNEGLASLVGTYGTYGTPRVGAETTPAYYATIYCVKYADDTSTSNSIWGISDNKVILQNTSNNFAINNTNFFINTTSGNVGIGMASPIKKFQVKVGTNQSLAVQSDGSRAQLLFMTDSGSAYNNGSIDASNLIINANSGGKIGIGTMSPITKFHIVDSLNQYAGNLSTSMNYSTLFIQTKSGSGAGIAFSQLTPNIQVIQGVYSDGSSSVPLVLNPYGGNVGIGTASPGRKLSVVGIINQTNALSCAITTTADGSIACTSDERLKDVLGNSTYGLNEIMKITPIKFNLKNESYVHIGFGAQNIQKVIPEATPIQRDGYLGLDANAITATLVNAIKEQQTEIEELKLENSNMKKALCEIKPELEICK